MESFLIRNIALFEEAGIQFGSGLHVLTGETGAGKSLVVDAVNFLCGAKADRDLIRTGSEQAYVEGVFHIQGLRDLEELLDSQGITCEEGQLILSREVNRAGRSVCRVNGLAFALAPYREITSRLIDLHGQHEHQSLLDEKKHLRFLDMLGDREHEELLEQTRATFLEYSNANREYDSAVKLAGDRQERVEILSGRRRELLDARLIPGEEEELQNEKNILRNADRLTFGLQGVREALFESSSQEPASSQLRQAQDQLDKISSYHPDIAAFQARLQELQYELEEVGHDLNTLSRSIYPDKNRLGEVETRLDQLRKLQRKYGPTCEAMLEVLRETQEELARYETLDEDLGFLKEQTEKSEQAYLLAAGKLSASRTRLARIHEGRILEALRELNMASSRFQIIVNTDTNRRNAGGQDQVEMMIAPNTGEDMKPLSRIASGGELSRVMLAMKALSAEKNDIPTMVFDEIDTGVSGKTAQVIARKLWEIGRYRQVICVSHLHQLAAMASSQYLVEKKEFAGRTRASVVLLDTEGRVQELAKMLGNVDTQGESGIQHAKVLLADGLMYRTEHPFWSGQTINDADK